MKNNIEKDTTETDTMQALFAARNAFEKYLERLNYEVAYWDIRFTTWELDSDFTTRLRRYEIESEVK